MLAPHRHPMRGIPARPLGHPLQARRRLRNKGLNRRKRRLRPHRKSVRLSTGVSLASRSAVPALRLPPQVRRLFLLPRAQLPHRLLNKASLRGRAGEANHRLERLVPALRLPPQVRRPFLLPRAQLPHRLLNKASLRGRAGEANHRLERLVPALRLPPQVHRLLLLPPQARLFHRSPRSRHRADRNRLPANPPHRVWCLPLGRPRRSRLRGCLRRVHRIRDQSRRPLRAPGSGRSLRRDSHCAGLRICAGKGAR